MAERPIVMTQLLRCTSPSAIFVWGDPVADIVKTSEELIHAEGTTNDQVLGQLNQKVDQYFKEQSKKLPPSEYLSDSFYYEVFGCSRVGDTTIKRKLTLWDFCRCFFLQVGG